MQTGTLKGGLEGAFSAMLFFGISGSYGGSDMMSRAIASGVGGGIISELQGGKFGHGFASAGVGSLAGNFAGKVDQNVGISIKRTVVAALAGGTASAVTGGKFGNGALTGAMSQAFGDWAQQASAAEASTNQFGDSISYEEASEFRIGPERRAPSEPAHADLGELQFVRSVANLFESFGNMEHCAYVCQGRTAGTSIKGFALSNVVSVGSRFSCSLSGSTCPLFTRAGSWIRNHPRVGAYTVNALEASLRNDVRAGTPFTVTSNSRFSPADMNYLNGRAKAWLVPVGYPNLLYYPRGSTFSIHREYRR